MDPLLKAYADKRRSEAGAPLEIHPATRTMLQGEVARTFSKGSVAHAGKRWSLAGLWPRLALAGSTMALLMILGSVYWQQMPRSPPKMEVGQTQAIGEGKSEKTTAGKISGDGFASAETVHRGKMRSQVAPATLPSPTQPAPVNGAAPSKDFQTRASSSTAAKTVRLVQADTPVSAAASSASGNLEQAEPVPMTVVALQKKAPSALTETQPLRWQFARSPSRQFLFAHRDKEDAAGPQNILVSFSMEQMGEQIRIMDADGSIYMGQIELSENKKLRQKATEMEKSEGPAEAGKGGLSESSKQEDVGRKAKEVFEKNRSMQTSRDFTFHVKGTSVTLQKAVEFQGSFLATDIEAVRGDRAMTKSEAIGDGTKSGTDVEQDAAAPADLGAVRRNQVGKPQEPASTIRIQGKALIEGGSTVEIDAALVEPK